MKITRNGQDIELTPDEPFQAYLEQESIFDRQNVKDNLKERLDELDRSYLYPKLKKDDDFINTAASELRRNQDKYDMDYLSALEEAFRTTLRKWEKEKKI